MLRDVFLQCGLAAILRGIRPDEISDVAGILYAQGFRVIEVPLNSPQAVESIRRLSKTLPADCITGAGTVFLPAQVEEVRVAGGRLIVMPHNSLPVIQAAIDSHLEVVPGVATASEAFAAFAAGPTLLKVFPADHLGPSVLKAWLSVLPREVGLIPVGGITPENLGTFIAAGAIGLGIGSALFRPGMTLKDIELRAKAFVAAWQQAKVS